MTPSQHMEHTLAARQRSLARRCLHACGCSLAAALVGGVFGVAGTIAHSVTWGPVPVGLVVGAIACGAILVAIRALTHDRGAALASGLGMLGMLVLISGVGPGGTLGCALGDIQQGVAERDEQDAADVPPEL